MSIDIISDENKVVKTMEVDEPTDKILRNYPTGYTIRIVK